MICTASSSASKMKCLDASRGFLLGERPNENEVSMRARILTKKERTIVSGGLFKGSR